MMVHIRRILGKRERFFGPDRLAVVVLLALVLFLFLPALIHPQYFLYPTFSSYSDVTVIHWPKAFLIAENWRAVRSLPLWTPANLGGMPLAANQLAMLFYPPAWLFLVLPINLVFNLLFILHLFWGGLGVYWLLRNGFNLDPIPALIGGLAFALNGKLLAHAAGGHASMVAALAWMPWAFAGVHMLLAHTSNRPGVWWAALSALALAMQITTHSLIVMYTGYLLAAYVVWQLLSQQRVIGRGSVRYSLYVLCLLALVPLLATLLTAIQILPLAELAGYSNRALSVAEASQFSLSPLTLSLGLLLPTAEGGHEMVIYLGLVSLLLAAWGIQRTDRRSWFFTGVVLVSIVFALGRITPLFELVHRWVPGMSWVRTPARVFFPAALAVALLAGMGAQRIASGRFRWSNLAGFAVGLLCLSLGIGLIAIQSANRAGLALACLPASTLLVIGLVRRRGLNPGVAVAVLACLLCVDLFSFGVSMMRFVSPEVAFAEGERASDELARQSGLFRTYSPSYSLPAQTAARAGLQTVDGVEPVHLAIYDRFMAMAGGYGYLFEGQPVNFSVTIPRFPPDQPLDRGLRGVQPNLEMLGLFNVEYVVSAFPIQESGLVTITNLQDMHIYRNDYSLPRAWIVPADVTFTSVAPPDDTAWAVQLTALAERAARSLDDNCCQANVIEYLPDRIQIEAQLDQPGTLVLAENWYPGWQATVDGVPRSVQNVAGLLRGVSLEAGEHQVMLEYIPAWFRWGMWLSLAGWAGLLLAGLAWCRSRVLGCGTPGKGKTG